MNIYFVVTHPIQYFVPLYRTLARQKDVSLQVIYLTDETLNGGMDKQFGVQFTWDIPLLEGYNYSFLPNHTWRKTKSGGFWDFYNPGIVRTLRSLPPGLVVFSGWNSITSILGFITVLFSRHKAAIRCDAPALQEKTKRGFRNQIRRFLLSKILFKYFVDALLYIGKQNYWFYRQLGVPESKLFFSPFSVDNDRFSDQTGNLEQRVSRAGLNIRENDFVVIYSGKLIQIKRPLDIVISFQKLSIPNKKLLLVGDGELRLQIEQYIGQTGMNDIICTGFVNQMSLPGYYKLADVMVLSSSSETWGLSVNEGMACGLAVVVSDSVGCGDDLVKSGLNGYIYPTGDIDALTAALQAVYQDTKGNRTMGIESRRIIEKYTLESTTTGILEAAKSTGVS